MRIEVLTDEEHSDLEKSPECKEGEIIFNQSVLL